MDALAQLTTALAGRYTVDREIGRGGMATVYLAHDVRHKRKVALKVLNPELGAVLGVERFLSEIQVTANLQHPNLLPLFDSGEAEGSLFYVMPFVEGESLRAAIEREKQLPIEHAVHIATSIASALDYAHRHGVIHRDLKPENILLHDGQPLVADFGIALAVSNAGGNRITQTGLSLGTPHYMSPEQATGDREIDGRTDVYSLGAVTYEMLVGEPPHDGKTSQAIIAKVLTDRPRGIRLSRPTVPRHVEAAVDRALAKLPADRFPTAHEFADALNGKALGPKTALERTGDWPEARPAPSRRRAIVPWVIAAFAVATAVIALATRRVAPADSAVVRYEISLPPNTSFGTGGGNQVAISRDGRFVGYVVRTGAGIRHLFLRSSDDVQPREVPGTDGASYPFFSPDGSAIGFYANGQLYRVPVAGGRAEVIAEVPSSLLGGSIRGVAWTSSGWLVVADGTTLVKVPAAGGQPQAFTRLDTLHGETGQFFPVALEDGKTIVYASYGMGGAANSRIGVASLDDGSSRVFDLPGSFPLGVVDGYLVYISAAGATMAVPFDARRRTLNGSPMPLVDRVAVDASTGMSFAQMAPGGALVYVSGATRRQLVIVGPNGAATSLGELGSFATPRFSPDGRRIAVTAGPLSQRDVWMLEVSSGAVTKLSSQGTLNDRPEWTPDGKSVIYRSNRRGRNSLWIQPADGGGSAVQLVSRAESQVDEGVMSPDGAYLLVQRDVTGNGEVWYRAMHGDTTLRPIISGSGAYGARFSPDGRWITYTSTETGIEQVYVRAFPSLTNALQVSVGGGGTPIWSADGKRIFYVTGGQLLAATLAGTNPFRVASRDVVLSRGYTFNGVHADYDIGRDGRSVLALQAPTENAQVVVVRNFAQELRARLRTGPR